MQIVHELGACSTEHKYHSFYLQIPLTNSNNKDLDDWYKVF